VFLLINNNNLTFCFNHRRFIFCQQWVGKKIHRLLIFLSTMFLSQWVHSLRMWSLVLLKYKVDIYKFVGFF
jgi:hypothetical protein